MDIVVDVDCLHKWLSIGGGHKLPLTPAVCYGVVNNAASDYWMFLYLIVGCKLYIQLSDYITSNNWNLAHTVLLRL